MCIIIIQYNFRGDNNRKVSLLFDSTYSATLRRMMKQLIRPHGLVGKNKRNIKTITWQLSEEEMSEGNHKDNPLQKGVDITHQKS